MSDEKEFIEVQGIVTEALPNRTFRVSVLDVKTEWVILAHASGKIVKNRIRILQGDRVVLEISPYDLTKGRIVRRLNQVETG